jgi:hypothetical protein
LLNGSSADNPDMPAVYVDPRKVREFEDAQGFEDWLRTNHGCESEVWIKLRKKASGLPSISPKAAIDVALCWGWIDAVRKSLDATRHAEERPDHLPTSAGRSEGSTAAGKKGPVGPLWQRRRTGGGATIAPMFGMSKQAKPSTRDAAKAAKPVTAAPSVAGDDSLVSVQVNLSPAQRDKLQRLGGDAWVRERIDKSREATSKP